LLSYCSQSFLSTEIFGYLFGWPHFSPFFSYLYFLLAPRSHLGPMSAWWQGSNGVWITRKKKKRRGEESSACLFSQQWYCVRRFTFGRLDYVRRNFFTDFSFAEDFAERVRGKIAPSHIARGSARSAAITDFFHRGANELDFELDFNSKRIGTLFDERKLEKPFVFCLARQASG